MTKEELIQEITAYFHERIPFNTLLGIEVMEASARQVVLRLPMKAELIGNTHHRLLHGGVTATLLDVAGGLAAMITTIERLGESETGLLRKRLQHLGTIDMRVDYLRPGLGREFFASAEVIRHGRRVAVTRMQVRSDRDKVIALGTATYMVG